MRSTHIRDTLLSRPQCYELLQSGFVRSKHNHLRQALESARLPVPCSVLDMGCGTGQDAPLFAATDRFRYVGVDISEEYVRRASIRFPGMVFRSADICHDTIQESGFDLVLVDSVFHHLNDSYAANVLERLPRHLKNAGVLIVQDMFIPEGAGIGDMLPRLIGRIDRGPHCRTLGALTKLLEEWFVVESRTTYSLRVIGLRFCDMGLFVCRPGRVTAVRAGK